MISRLFIALFVFLLPAEGVSQEYVIAPRDHLRITVYDHDDLSINVRVRDGGEITYPLLGEIHVGGVSVQEAERTLGSLLADGYIIDPQVIISLEEYKEAVYVTGEVKKPGSYPYEKGMTVLKAITIAGGFTDKGASGRIKVVRKIAGKESVRKVTIDDDVEAEDVIIVPQRFF